MSDVFSCVFMEWFDPANRGLEKDDAQTQGDASALMQIKKTFHIESSSLGYSLNSSIRYLKASR